MLVRASPTLTWAKKGAALSLSKDEIAEMRADSWNGRWDTELFDFIGTMLKPHYRLAILSDAGSSTRERIKEWINEDLFEVIVISAEEKVRKPDPRIYEIVLARLGVGAETAVFIDDRIKNVEAARQLGMKAILYEEFAPMRLELDRYLAE